MDKDIRPIEYIEFRIKYLFLGEAPVKGSDKMLYTNGYLNRLLGVLFVLMPLCPLVPYASYLPTLVWIYVMAFFCAALLRPIGYLLYRLSFYRYYKH